MNYSAPGTDWKTLSNQGGYVFYVNNDNYDEMIDKFYDEDWLYHGVNI
jgi:hypothetical protein